MLAAMQNEIGIDTLEVEPSGDFGVGPKVTVGEEIAPGLVARFSRQFGSDPYDEATVEYYLSPHFPPPRDVLGRPVVVARSPFRRIERAGIDS